MEDINLNEDKTTEVNFCASIQSLSELSTSMNGLIKMVEGIVELLEE